MFLDTIDYDDVVVADQTGLDGCAFTFWGGALTATQIAFGNRYVLFLGPIAFGTDAIMIGRLSYTR